jgi:hypothetical protein
LLAERIIEVDDDLVEAMMGGGSVNAAGAVVVQGMGDDARDPGIRSVLFTDIVGSTEITQRLGDAAGMAMVNAHDTVVRAALADNGGREVKHTGDGIMASFASVARAIQAAIGIQRGLEEHSAEAEHPITVRIGVSAGEPVAVDSALTIADGIAVKRPGALTLALIDRWVDDVVVVGEDDVAEAMVFLLERAKLVVEGAGAVGVAALLSGKVAGWPRE